MAKLRTRRAGVAVGPRPDRIEVVVDNVSALVDGRVVASFAEVKAGDRQGRRRPAPGTRQGAGGAGARVGDDQPKLGAHLPRRGARRGRGRRPARPPAPGLLVEQYETMLANDPGVRLGEDIEALHQLRVATRRSRALLRAGTRARRRPTGRSRCGRELAWLGGLLGPVRDPTFSSSIWTAEAGALEGDDARAFRRLRAGLAAERNRGRAELFEAMGSTRYFELLDRLGGGAAAAPAGDYAQPLADIACR